ncbi:hypothetical protein E2C01_093015 [Portunus trituberculatus]|uniref:Uncharacterized protein n=1 Tax=Portunus trituberculatus TaxID=210409 RepID=A0A5B7JS79_PORTR|nr:hypothetical protein [Portunus trituberculatus]
MRCNAPVTTPAHSPDKHGPVPVPRQISMRFRFPLDSIYSTPGSPHGLTTTTDPLGRYFLGTSYLKAQSEEAQPTLGPWTGFEPMPLETPRTPKHAWFHCTTAAPIVSLVDL